MKIGIISDTHDRMKSVEKAIKIFKKHQVKYVFHAGDFVTKEVVEKFNGMRLCGVLGNNDTNRSEMLEAFSKIGGEVSTKFFDKEINGITFGMYHGTDREILKNFILSEKYNVVIYGHTHRVAKRNVKNCLVLNPGPASGIWNKSTIMLLDIKKKTMHVELVTLSIC